jgi:hypothetical protein
MQPTGLTRQDDRIIDLIRPATPLYRESSIAAALDALRRTGDDLVPLVEGSALIGVVWANDARTALLEGVSLTTPVSSSMDASPPALLSTASREEARAVLLASGRPALIVLDPDGRYLGVVRVFDLYHTPERAARPPLVGGMATPMGVYLTNGSLAGGAKGWPLVLTGALMTVMLMVGVAVTALLSSNLRPWLGPWGHTAIENLLPIFLFFLQVRLSPIAATHGAEHMVVHAIERGEALRPEIVRRMPRVHPRCGTNLAVGALLFTGLVQAFWSTLHEAGALVALVLTIAVWRPLGSFFQQHITTKTPRDEDIESGIAAAEDLIAQYRHSDRRTPNLLGRIAASGLPLIIVGSVAVMAIAPYLLSAVGLSEATIDMLFAEPGR